MLSLYSTRLLCDLLCRTLIGREPLDAEGGPQPGAATQAAHGPPAEMKVARQLVERPFGKEQSLDLPGRTHRALDALSELRAIFDGLYELAGDPSKPVTADDIAQTRRNLRELTKVGEREIHEVVLSCTRARRQLYY